MARNSNKRNGKNTPGFLSDEEEKESVTSCVCGKNRPNGLMIQCEKCKVWQHCNCVNIPDKASIPPHYNCKECLLLYPVLLKSKKSSRDSSKLNTDKKITKQTETKPTSPAPSSKKSGERSNKNKSLPRVKSNNEIGPIKIRLNLPEKEEYCSSGGSGSQTKNSRSSPVEFTTKRGRKTTKVAYRTFSEEDPEANHEPPILPYSSPLASPKTKKTKTIIEVPVETPVKKKRKENKIKGIDSINITTQSIILNSTKSPDIIDAPLKIYLTTKIPTPPHELLNAKAHYDDNPPPSPTILPSNIPLSSLLTRPPSPPPRPKATSSKMPIHDIRKRVNAIERYIEQHQSHLKEHLKSNPQKYKTLKLHYAASSKQAKELLQTINEFNLKLESFK